MNTPNDDGTLPGRVMVLGKVGKGKAVLLKTMVVEGRPLFAPSTSLDDFLASHPRSSWQKPQVMAGGLNPLQLTPAQLIHGNPTRDRELWRRMVYLDAAMKGQRVIELNPRDSRRGGLPSDVELSAGEYFTVDSSQLSCSAASERGHAGEGI